MNIVGGKRFSWFISHDFQLLNVIRYITEQHESIYFFKKIYFRKKKAKKYFLNALQEIIYYKRDISPMFSSCATLP